jgi:hypothetical protein
MYNLNKVSGTMKSFSLIALFFLNAAITAAEVFFDEPVVPSSVIKKISFRIPVIKSPIETYIKQEDTVSPRDINTIYSIAGNNTSVKKKLESALAEKKKTEIVLESKIAISKNALKAEVLWRLLDWAYSSIADKSFVGGLGKFLTSLQMNDENPSFIRRNVLLKNALSFSNLLGFIEMSEALKILLKINKNIMEQLKPGNYAQGYIANKLFPQFSDELKRIAQLDVEFAQRMDPKIFEKTLAQPKYANALTSTELTVTDRKRMAELDMLIKAMRTLQEDAYEFYPTMIEQLAKPATQESQEMKD